MHQRCRGLDTCEWEQGVEGMGLDVPKGGWGVVKIHRAYGHVASSLYSAWAIPKSQSITDV